MPREVIGVKLTADTRQFVRGMHDAVRSFASVEYIAGRASSRFGGVLSKAFNVIGFAAGGALIAGMGGAITSQRMNQYIFRPALEQAKKFNKEFYRTAFLANIDPKGSQAKEFRELAIKAGLSSRFSGAEAMQGIGNLMTGGLTSGEAKAFLPSLLEFTEATFGELDLPQAAKIMAVASKKFDFTGKDPTTVGKEIADTLISVRQASRLEFGEILGMMDSMNNASSLLKTSMQETFALSTALLKEEGMGPRRGGRWASSLGNALTQLRTLLVEIDGLEVRGGKGPRAAAELLGLDPSAFVDESGKIIKGIDTLKVIDKKLQGYGEAEKGSILAQLFTKQESRSLFQTIQKFEMLDEATGKTLKGFEALDYQIKVFNESQGLAAKGAELNRQTLEGQLEILKGVQDTVYQLLGESYLEGTYPAIKAVKGFLEVITDIGSQNPQLVRVTSILTILTATALMLGTVAFTGLAASGLLSIFVFGGLLKGSLDLTKSFMSLFIAARNAEKGVERFSKTAVKSFRQFNDTSKKAFKESERLFAKFGNTKPDSEMYFLLKKLSNATGINSSVGPNGETLLPKRDMTFLKTVYEIWGATALIDTLKAPLLAQLKSAYPVLARVLPMIGSALLNPYVLAGVVIVLTLAAAVISAIVFWVGIAILAFTNLGIVLGVYFVKKLFESGNAMDNFLKKFNHLELVITSMYKLLSGKGVEVGDKSTLQKAGLWNIVEQGTMILYRFIEAFKTFWKSLDWKPLETALEPIMKAMGFINPEGWARSSVYNWQLIGFRIAQVFNMMIKFAAITIDVLLLIQKQWAAFAAALLIFMSPVLLLFGLLFGIMVPFIALFLVLAAMGTLFGLVVYGWINTIVQAVNLLVDGLINLFHWLAKLKQEGPAIVRFAMGDFSAGKDMWDGWKATNTPGEDVRNMMRPGTPLPVVPVKPSPGLGQTLEPGSVRPAGNQPLFSGRPGAYEPVDLNAQGQVNKAYKAQDAATMKSITNNMSVTMNNPTVTDPSDLSKLEELVKRTIENVMSDKRLFGN